MEATTDHRTPLMFIHGAGARVRELGELRRKDNTVPASLSKKHYEKYQDSGAQTDYVEFEGRPHLMMAAEGWEEIAAEIERWVSGVLEAPVLPAQGSSV